MGRWGDDGDGEDDGDDEPSILVSANERDIRCGRAYNGGGARSGSPPQCILGRAADRVEGGR